SLVNMTVPFSIPIDPEARRRRLPAASRRVDRDERAASPAQIRASRAMGPAVTGPLLDGARGRRPTPAGRGVGASERSQPRALVRQFFADAGALSRANSSNRRRRERRLSETVFRPVRAPPRICMISHGSEAQKNPAYEGFFYSGGRIRTLRPSGYEPAPGAMPSYVGLGFKRVR